MKTSVETVIIGGGISGLAAARNLHDGRRDFVVLTDRLGAGCTTNPDFGERSTSAPPTLRKTASSSLSTWGKRLSRAVT